MRLAYTGLLVELEHLKIKTTSIDEMFASVMGEYEKDKGYCLHRGSNSGPHAYQACALKDSEKSFFFSPKTLRRCTLYISPAT
jgi:hypothetical protein